MPNDLDQLAHSVIDESGFIRFLEALAADRSDEFAEEAANPSSRYAPGANGWENGTIEAFLDAASAWAKASLNGMPHYEKSANPWTRCAAILLMGKHYEQRENANGEHCAGGQPSTTSLFESESCAAAPPHLTFGRKLRSREDHP